MDELVEEVRKELMGAIADNRIVLPTLPEVALKVRDAAEDPRTDVGSMASVISNDAAITARLIRVSNSPLLRAASPIQDVKMAISRLGIQYTCNLAVGLAMEQMFQATSEAVDSRMRRVWSKSTEIAGISAVLARTYSRLKADQATLAGLVCKIGALPILRFAEEHSGLIKRPELLDQLIAELHCEIGGLILKTWEFPDELQLVPREYLKFDRAPASLDYTDVVMVANLQSTIGSEDPLAQMDWSGISAFERLGLDSSFNAMEVEDLSETMEASIAALK